MSKDWETGFGTPRTVPPERPLFRPTPENETPRGLGWVPQWKALSGSGFEAVGVVVCFKRPDGTEVQRLYDAGALAKDAQWLLGCELRDIPDEDKSVPEGMV